MHRTRIGVLRRFLTVAVVFVASFESGEWRTGKEKLSTGSDVSLWKQPVVCCCAHRGLGAKIRFACLRVRHDERLQCMAAANLMARTVVRKGKGRVLANAASLVTRSAFYSRDRSLRQQRVRLSVCPSVCHTPVLCRAERKQDREMYTF